MRLDFEELLGRLLAWLRSQVRNGALTERGLARRAGLSQSHIHNVLKGARILTPTTADRILEALGVSLLDLLDREETERVLAGAQKREPGGSGELFSSSEPAVRLPPGRALLRGKVRAPRRPSSAS
jgi:transcriptional regulator with XRE-family HTH domain